MASNLCSYRDLITLVLYSWKQIKNYYGKKDVWKKNSNINKSPKLLILMSYVQSYNAETICQEENIVQKVKNSKNNSVQNGVHKTKTKYCHQWQNLKKQI